MKVKVIVHEEKDGGFVAEVPALPGCVTDADSREELLANLREVVEGYLLAGSGAFQPIEPGGVEEEVEV